MENAVEALKMAGSVLIFVMALSIAMLSFTQARTAIGTLVKYSDREYSTIEDNDIFYYRKATDTARYVGIETIIPTIYRALSESYKIVFKFPDSYYIYINKNSGTEVCKIDSIEENGISNDKQDFLNGILYGEYDTKVGNFGPSTNRTLNSTCLYDYLKNKEENNYKIKETLGTYYMEDRMDAKGNRLNTRVDETGAPSEISDVNKRELRVITYTFEPR